MHKTTEIWNTEHKRSSAEKIVSEMSLMLETYGKIYIYYYSLDSMVLKFMVLMYELTVLTTKVPPTLFLCHF